MDIGLKLSELINAQLNDLDMKRREGVLRKRTFQSLKKGLRVRENVERVWDDTIFISRKGEKLKKRNVQRLITRIQRSAGLKC